MMKRCAKDGTGERVSIQALPALVMRMGAAADVDPLEVAAAFDIGFWPGGDRDGNPYVDAATTLRVAESAAFDVAALLPQGAAGVAQAHHVQRGAGQVGHRAVSD